MSAVTTPAPVAASERERVLDDLRRLAQDIQDEVQALGKRGEILQDQVDALIDGIAEVSK